MSDITVASGLMMIKNLIGDCILMESIYNDPEVASQSRYSAILLQEANLDLVCDIITEIFKAKMKLPG